jgi:two-component system nitrate/nitrite sensor histidine kinase NarX
LLKPIESTLGFGPVSLCLTHHYSLSSPKNEAYTSFSSQERQAPAYCKLPNCAQCPIFINRGLIESGAQVVSFALRNDHDRLGDLRVEVPAGAHMQDWQNSLMTALAELFSASLSLNKLGQNQARIALMEERAVIARELHDSLAQALSYQKIQLARLKKQIGSDFPKEDINETLLEIQNGLNTAYRQLRELLVTFRTKLDTPGLASAVQTTVQEFARLSSLEVQLEYALEHCPLTPNEEINCLQIIREALSNVVKHAHASQCKLSLHQDPAGYIHICIDDDGIGIKTDSSPAGHYGLNILTERARSLTGEVHIGALPKGTRVHVQFLPQYKRSQLD